MTMSAFDLAIAFGVVALMPWVIWSNFRNRDSGPVAYLWRERPTLVWAGLAFLGLIVLFSVVELLTHYGFVPANIEDTLSAALGIPMFGLSIFIIWFGSAAAVGYLQRLRPHSED